MPRKIFYNDLSNKRYNLVNLQNVMFNLGAVELARDVHGSISYFIDDPNVAVRISEEPDSYVHKLNRNRTALYPQEDHIPKKWRTIVQISGHVGDITQVEKLIRAGTVRLSKA
jgi:hypothetical protein